MSMFKPADNTMAYFKAGFMGEAGSGKTHTATLVLIGLIKHLKAKGIAGAEKPVYMLDTEQGSAWIKPMFDAAGIPLLVAKTRAFKDLVPALRDAEKNASALLVDSITHFWEDLQNSYMNSKQRTRLEFQDWAVLKKMWRTFSDAYVNSELHCVLCGRLGFEYDQTTDDRGRKNIEKSGVKMQAEKSLGYEPNILVWMERDMDLNSKIVSRTATILKDRSQRLDGKQYENPTFATFLPHVDYLALGGKHEGVDLNRNSEDAIPDDDAPLSSDLKSIRRKIVLDEIQALLVEHYPSTGAEDKKAKASLIKKHFKTTSWTEIETLMPLYDLQKNFNFLHIALTGKPSRYGTPEDVPPPVADEIPHMDAPPVVAATSEDLKAQLQASVDAEPDDRDTILSDLRNAMSAAFNPTRISQVWREFSDMIEKFDPPRKAKAQAIKAEALKRSKELAK
jgi:hypothetical protein